MSEHPGDRATRLHRAPSLILTVVLSFSAFAQELRAQAEKVRVPDCVHEFLANHHELGDLPRFAEIRDNKLKLRAFQVLVKDDPTTKKRVFSIDPTPVNPAQYPDHVVLAQLPPSGEEVDVGSDLDVIVIDDDILSPPSPAFLAPALVALVGLLVGVLAGYLFGRRRRPAA